MTEIILSEADRRQLIEVFIAEAEETLSRFEELLLQLEQSADDPELLHEIFRAAHTLKGNASSLQFTEMTSFAHVVEETLERLRNGQLHATPERVSQLLQAVDALRDLSHRSIAGDAALTEPQQELLASLSRGFGQSAPAAPAQQPARATSSELRTAYSLRVDMEKLDRMLDLTGEISIARGRVRELVSAGEDRDRVLDAVHELDRLSLDLQEQVMDARLVPLAPSLRPFHRIVRDLATREGKRVNFVIDCGDVEVDTAVVENLKDPVTHMIRNAIDHGIEMPDARVRSGKPEAGTIRIAAAQENGAIALRFSDDGSGIDEHEIANRARVLGMEAERLTRQELLGLIFQPGFTTAKEVSDVSGRGVGMDIVRRNVERLRGSVSVASEAGRGMTITIRLPLTVAVIEGFGVRVADETYVFPLEAVVECTDFPAATTSDMRGVLNVRGEALPFLCLRQFFGYDSPALARQNVVIVQTDTGRAGIVVDELLGSHQTVMKPLKGELRRVPGIAGSSILGSGRVALIIDVPELLKRV